jgi:hypothetical protein
MDSRWLERRELGLNILPAALPFGRLRHRCGEVRLRALSCLRCRTSQSCTSGSKTESSSTSDKRGHLFANALDQWVTRPFPRTTRTLPTGSQERRGADELPCERARKRRHRGRSLDPHLAPRDGSSRRSLRGGPLDESFALPCLEPTDRRDRLVGHHGRDLPRRDDRGTR